MFHFLPAISRQQAHFFLSFDMNILLPHAMEIRTLLNSGKTTGENNSQLHPPPIKTGTSTAVFPF